MTNEEFLILLEEYIAGLQMPRILSELSGIAKRSNDKAANKIGQVAMAAATAAQSDNTKLIALLRAAALYFNQVDTDITTITGGSVKVGITTGFTLPGTPPETVTVTETGKTWVTANTIVIPFTPGPITSAVEFYGTSVGNYVVGDGFDVVLYNRENTAAGAGPDVAWVAFVDGYNA